MPEATVMSTTMKKHDKSPHFAILNKVTKNLSRFLFVNTRSCGGGPLTKLLTARDVKSAPITFPVRATRCYLSCWWVLSMEQEVPRESIRLGNMQRRNRI